MGEFTPSMLVIWVGVAATAGRLVRGWTRVRELVALWLAICVTAILIALRTDTLTQHADVIFGGALVPVLVKRLLGPTPEGDRSPSLWRRIHLDLSPIRWTQLGLSIVGFVLQLSGRTTTVRTFGGILVAAAYGGIALEAMRAFSRHRSTTRELPQDVRSPRAARLVGRIRTHEEIERRRVQEAIVGDLTVDFIDYRRIWCIAKAVDSTSPDEDVRHLAVESLVRLLERGVIIAGHLKPPGEFVAWGTSREESIERIRRGAEELSGRPYPGDVAWFDLEGAPGRYPFETDGEVREIKQQIVDAFAYTDLDFWMASLIVKDVTPGLDDLGVRRVTLRCLVELLDERIIVAGGWSLTGDFVAWEGSVEQVIRRVETAAEELEGPPYPGEVAYFALHEDAPGR